MTILEIEYYEYKKGIFLYSKTISGEALKKQLKEIEMIYDRENDNFIDLLCIRYAWSVLEINEFPDYIYDRDTGMLLKQY